MAKIAFIQNLALEYLGVMHISSILKKNGHTVEVFIDSNSKRIISDIQFYNPDIVGFSCFVNNYNWCIKIARLIKSNIDTLIVFGGPHATFCPHIIEEPCIDIVCRGEGEIPMLELADKLDNREDITFIKNFWVKFNNKIIRNDIRNLIDNLDILPFPDRELYYKKYPSLNKSQKHFMAMRGCPFKCSYCYNEYLQEIYKDKGKYIRYRTVDNMISEIKFVCEKYNTKTIYMLDDVFVLDKDWLFEFLFKYKKEIVLPFICCARVDLLTEEIIKKLKEANCIRIFFGIESGSEFLRKKLLNKYISDEDIIRATILLKKYRIKFRTYNILGIPEETIDDALNTVKINIKIKTDYPWCSLLQPYPKTKIEEYARRNNLLDNIENISIYQSFFKYSVIKLKNKREIINLQRFFILGIKFPFLLPIIKILIKLPFNLFYDLIYWSTYTYSYWKSENLKLKEVIDIAFKNFKSFVNN